METVCSALFGQQRAQPCGVQPAESETSETEGTVVEVQTKAAEQQDNYGSVAPPHTHSQSPAELLLRRAYAQQDLNQLQRTTFLTHLKKFRHSITITMLDHINHSIKTDLNLYYNSTGNQMLSQYF